MSSVKYPELIKEETLAKLGFAVELSSLESLVKTNSLTHEIRTKSIEYLKSKGIIII